EMHAARRRRAEYPHLDHATDNTDAREAQSGQHSLGPPRPRLKRRMNLARAYLVGRFVHAYPRDFKAATRHALPLHVTPTKPRLPGHAPTGRALPCPAVPRPALPGLAMPRLP